MVGGNLGSDTDALLLGAADKLNRALGADMGDMQSGSGQLGESQVTGDHDFLSGGRYTAQSQPGGEYAFVHLAVIAEDGIFAVVNNRQPEGTTVDHCLAHQARVHNRTAVVAVGNHPG